MVEIKGSSGMTHDASFGEGKWDYTEIEVLNRPEPINEPPAHLEEGIAASLFIDLRIN